MRYQDVMHWLGYAGLLPFYGFAALCWVPALAGLGARGFIIYSLTIFAFLAGTLWGSAIVREGRDKLERIVVSNLAAVLGTAAALIGETALSVALLGCAHLGLLGYEVSRDHHRGWYIRLRKQLTLIATLPHIVLVFAP